jgi:hypothetical protein
MGNVHNGWAGNVLVDASRGNSIESAAIIYIERTIANCEKSRQEADNDLFHALGPVWAAVNPFQEFLIIWQ